jgi:alkanesulfonate monooxygenase SsuD/methylene tetrahydromethanopterin reductase-like flavin-dependent oxidoreductase (luciferase family)
MKFYVSTAFLETSEVVEIAKAADDLGYDGMGIPDHVINLETLTTPYPYTKNGERRWQAFTDWPDPWVMIGAIALVTTRLRFVTTVYLPAMRDPPRNPLARRPIWPGADWSSASALAGARKSSP